MATTYVVKSGLVDEVSIEGYELNSFEAAEILADVDGIRCAVFLEPVQRTHHDGWSDEDEQCFLDQVREVANDLAYENGSGSTYSLIFDPGRDETTGEPLYEDREVSELY
jgi:hypothetical protein